MYSPNRSAVVFRSLTLISGVPVKASRVALGKRLEEIVAQVARLRAMGLVDHQQNALGRVHEAERRVHRQIAQHVFQVVRQVPVRVLLELVDHHHVQVGCRSLELRLQVFGTGDVGDFLAGQFRRLAELLLQVFAVVDQADLVILQVVAHAQLADHEDHRERLARSLRVPDDARTLFGRLPLPQPVDDLADGPVLLVAGDDLRPGPCRHP